MAGDGPLDVQEIVLLVLLIFFEKILVLFGTFYLHRKLQWLQSGWIEMAGDGPLDVEEITRWYF